MVATDRQTTDNRLQTATIPQSLAENPPGTKKENEKEKEILKREIEKRKKENEVEKVPYAICLGGDQKSKEGNRNPKREIGLIVKKVNNEKKVAI